MPEPMDVATFIDRVAELCNELYRSKEIFVSHMEVESTPVSNPGDLWELPYPHTFHVAVTTIKP